MLPGIFGPDKGALTMARPPWAAQAQARPAFGQCSAPSTPGPAPRFVYKAISPVTGFDRKTVRKYLAVPDAIPKYGPRPAGASKLDAFKPYLEERLSAGVLNAALLLRELRERSYTGGYAILKDWMQPQREAADAVAVGASRLHRGGKNPLTRLPMARPRDRNGFRPEISLQRVAGPISLHD